MKNCHFSRVDNLRSSMYCRKHKRHYRATWGCHDFFIKRKSTLPPREFDIDEFLREKATIEELYEFMEKKFHTIPHKQAFDSLLARISKMKKIENDLMELVEKQDKIRVEMEKELIGFREAAKMVNNGFKAIGKFFDSI